MKAAEFRARQLDWVEERLPYQARSDTSRAAATDMLQNATTVRAKVLRELRLYGDNGATDEEMQRAMRMNPSTQRPRRIELVSMGLVRDSGKRRLTLSKRLAVVWVANPASDA